MGLSYWYLCNGPPTKDGKPPACNPAPTEPYQPTPIPLLANTTVVSQPAGLYTLTARYTAAANSFIESSAAAGDPFLLYLPFNHIHAPSSCGQGFCGRSARGPVGDATEEVDWAIGQIMDTVRKPSNHIASNTLVFFTRCLCGIYFCSFQHSHTLRSFLVTTVLPCGLMATFHYADTKQRCGRGAIASQG
jgi:hypothetical protein